MLALVATEEDSISRTCASFLVDRGHEVAVARNGPAACNRFRGREWDLLLIDASLPPDGGLDVLRTTREAAGGDPPKAVMLCADWSDEDVERAVAGGAVDVIAKSSLPEALSRVLTLVGEQGDLRIGSVNVAASHWGGSVLAAELARRYGFCLVSAQMHETIQFALAYHRAPEAQVLIQGETGTGKECIARLVHGGLTGNHAPFIDINCAAIPDGLIESELFGYEEGAFTGARTGGHAGRFELADGGSLFLDEIGELPLEHQAKLLPVLEQRKVRRIGGAHSRPVSVRVICADNKDLAAEVVAGRFRGDLYYRPD